MQAMTMVMSQMWPAIRAWEPQQASLVALFLVASFLVGLLAVDEVEPHPALDGSMSRCTSVDRVAPSGLSQALSCFPLPFASLHACP